MAERVLVTGASAGFGRLVVEALLSRGHVVVASMRGVSGRNRQAAEEMGAKGAHVVEIDVTDGASVEKGVDEALARAGGIDVVVNNAGVGVIGWQEAFTVEDWKKVFDINVFGVQRVNRAVLPHMRARRTGLLVHVSSILGRMVIPFYGPYNASKFALEALADNYRVELSGLGIESVIVEPGGYGTDFGRNLVPASDEPRTASYGPAAQAPQQAFAAFEKVLHGPDAPDPRWVADAVADLVAKPRGERPFRTVVDRLGMGAALEPYNEAAAAMQRTVYGAFGMAGALELKLG
jgi:NAD(P)-dependent dehydrogenase (short-subunit alcohol dehydrogenase family)